MTTLAFSSFLRLPEPEAQFTVASKNCNIHINLKKENIRITFQDRLCPQPVTNDRLKEIEHMFDIMRMTRTKHPQEGNTICIDVANNTQLKDIVTFIFVRYFEIFRSLYSPRHWNLSRHGNTIF